MQSYKKRKPSFLKGHRHICRICTPAELIPNKGTMTVLFDVCPSCWLSEPEERAVQQDMFLAVYGAIEKSGGLIPKSHFNEILLQEDISFDKDMLKDCMNLMYARGFMQSTTIGKHRHFSFTKAGALHLKTLQEKPVIVKNQMAMSF